MGPKEDPDAKRDRMRQRRLSVLDRRETAEEAAGGLTSDLRAVYGLKGISMFGTRGTSKPSAAKTGVKSLGFGPGQARVPSDR